VCLITPYLCEPIYSNEITHFVKNNFAKTHKNGRKDTNSNFNDRQRRKSLCQKEIKNQIVKIQKDERK
jgi:hypothetical protein